MSFLLVGLIELVENRDLQVLDDLDLTSRKIVSYCWDGNIANISNVF